MPRRNRNAHAPAIDTDELAAQAAQLTAELGSVHIPVSHPADEIQLRLGGIPPTGKSARPHRLPHSAAPGASRRTVA